MLIVRASVFGSQPHPTWRAAVIWLPLRNVFRYSNEELSPDACTLRCIWKEARLQKSTAIRRVSPRRCSGVTKIFKHDSLLNKPFVFAVTFSKCSLKFTYSNTHPGNDVHWTRMPSNGIGISVTAALGILPLCAHRGQWYRTAITASRWHLKARIVLQTYI